MHVMLNGEARRIVGGTTVAALLTDLGFGEKPVAVELNADVLPRERYAGTELRAGDVVEIVQFVGGG